MLLPSFLLLYLVLLISGLLKILVAGYLLGLSGGLKRIIKVIKYGSFKVLLPILLSIQ